MQQNVVFIWVDMLHQELEGVQLDKNRKKMKKKIFVLNLKKIH